MQERSHDTVVGDQFGRRAASYLTSAVHMAGEDLAELRALVQARPASVALDLGSGAGHATFALSPLVQKVIAYDLSVAMTATVAREAARRGMHNIEVRQGSVAALPYADATFDLVVSRYSAHHWSDAGAGLREARRVLKPDGRAVFMDAIAPGPALLDTWLQTLELLRDPSHVRDYTLAQWHALMEQAGLRPDRARSFRIRMEFASWVARMDTPPAHATAIRSLQDSASAEVRRYFEIEQDGSFTIDSMLISALG